MRDNNPSTPAEIRERLRDIGTEADALMMLFKDGRVSAAEAEQARERFRLLKEQLESAYRSMATVRGEAALSRVASAFYWPAIQDAWANSGISGVRWDTHPHDKWFDALYEVRFYMSYWGDNLKRAEEKKVPVPKV
jgi:hypothetical protein